MKPVQLGSVGLIIHELARCSAATARLLIFGPRLSFFKPVIASGSTAKFNLSVLTPINLRLASSQFFPYHFYPKEKRILGSLNLGLLARQATTRLASQANYSIYHEWTVFGN